jgi:acetyl-CoA carboxylase carboxyl transferase subunit beta
MNSNERIESLIDSKTWRPYMKLFLLATLTFKDQKSYPERLEAQLRTGLQDAVQTGTGLIDGIPVALGFGLSFHGRQYGFSCWRKITRLIEYATKRINRYLNLCFRWSSYARRHFKFNANGKNFCRMFINRVQIYYIFQY